MDLVTPFTLQALHLAFPINQFLLFLGYVIERKDYTLLLDTDLVEGLFKIWSFITITCMVILSWLGPKPYSIEAMVSIYVIDNHQIKNCCIRLDLHYTPSRFGFVFGHWVVKRYDLDDSANCPKTRNDPLIFGICDGTKHVNTFCSRKSLKCYTPI